MFCATQETITNSFYVVLCRDKKGIAFVLLFPSRLHIWAHCSKLKMNGKKLSLFQFHFPGLLGTSLDKWDYLRCPIIEKKNSFLVLTSGKFLEALGSGIGIGIVFCLSFSVSNTVSNLWYKLIPFTTSIPLPTSNSYYRLSYVSIH